MVRWQALDAVTRQFELCDVGADTRVAIVLDPDTGEDVLALCRLALDRLGADAIEIRAGVHGSTEHLAATTSRAAVVVDCTDRGLEPGRRQRVITMSAVTSQAEHWRPHVNLRHRLAALRDVIAGAEEMSASDAHGTELTIRGRGGAVRADDGFAVAAGERAFFPGGRVVLDVEHRTVSGEVVLLPGDVNLTLPAFIRSPVRLTLTRSRISEVDSQSADGDELLALFELSSAPDPWSLSAVAIGANPGHSRPAGPAAFDERLLERSTATIVAGTTTLMFGPLDDPSVELVLPRRSISVDGVPVAANGALVGAYAPDPYETAG